jgi:hypothetical protein
LKSSSRAGKRRACREIDPPPTGRPAWSANEVAGEDDDIEFEIRHRLEGSEFEVKIGEDQHFHQNAPPKRTRRFALALSSTSKPELAKQRFQARQEAEGHTTVADVIFPLPPLPH